MFGISKFLIENYFILLSQFALDRVRMQVHQVHKIDFVFDLLNLGGTVDKYRLEDSLYTVYSLMIIFIDIERRECHFRVNGK